MSWSPDGKLLASGSCDKTVRLWHSDGTPAGVLKNHSDMVMTVAWSPDGSRLASAGSDRKIRVWQSNGTIERVLPGDFDLTASVKWSADGTRLYATGRSGHVQSWAVNGANDQRKVLARLPSGNALAWQSDGEWLAAAGVGRIRLINADGHSGQQFNTDGFRSTSLAWSPDGQTIAVGDESFWRASRVRLWRLNGAADPIVNHSGSSVNSVVWNSESNMVAVSDNDGTVHIWNPVNGHTEWKSVLIGDNAPLTFAADSTLIDGDQESFDEHFVYIVEQSDGRLKTLVPNQFDRIVKSNP